jgi:hypothetical protein
MQLYKAIANYSYSCYKLEQNIVVVKLLSGEMLTWLGWRLSFVVVCDSADPVYMFVIPFRYPSRRVPEATNNGTATHGSLFGVWLAQPLVLKPPYSGLVWGAKEDTQHVITGVSS